MAAIPSSRAAQPRRPGRPIVGPALRYILLSALTILFLLPFYIIVRNALLTQSQITGFEWVWLPFPPQFANFAALFDDPTAPMLTGLRNSTAIAITQTIGRTILASLAGYGLARIPFAGATRSSTLCLAR